jgi:glucose/arabinose dehydrogenase
MPRSAASYLGAFAAALLLHGCGAGGDAPPVSTRTADCPEIFASGFRNPWRWSFDRGTGQLWVGDVGQDALEEIDRVVLGGNYGWRCFEGSRATGFPCGAAANLQPPIAEYDRIAGRSVTGGYVYRGSAVAGLAGRYVFGDFITGRIWHIATATPPTLVVSAGFDSGLRISSFGEGLDGELYMVHYGASGLLYRLSGSSAALSAQQVFTNLVFSQPVAMLQAPSDNARWFVVEQAGRVRVFNNDLLVTTFGTFVDISARVASGGEMGLLGMAFHPAFSTNGKVYLAYTNTVSSRVLRVSEFTSADNGLTLDPNSERILMVVDQPETNHNGGQVAFGPDGYLYIGMGDGGGANDQHGTIGNGQLMTTLLGKMLRIDVNGGPPYAIPPGNPFAAGALCGAP